MKPLLHLFAVGVVLMTTPFSFAASPDWAEADVVIIGEFHDNPHHHAAQARLVQEGEPKAVVFEMLLPDEAAILDALPRDPDAIRAAAAAFHWSNIGDYAEVLAASPVILGAALPRDAVRTAFAEGAAAVFEGDAALFGLTASLPADEQEAREDLQFAAHCEAMPRELMPGMVEAQRLRDAAFARRVIEAGRDLGYPIVLITGNGHARTDWGVPAVLARAAPDLSVYSLAQGEEGRAPPGTFDQVNTAETIERGDPCAAFR